MADWFESLEAEPQERADLYLCALETDALGVKLRSDGDRLELKLRERDQGRSEFPGGVAGNVEQWQKWSFETAKVDHSPLGLGLPSRFWLGVNKVRRLATYELPSGRFWLTDRRPGEGCSVELTELRAAGTKWYTLGFEAFGREDNIHESLAHAAGAFFNQPKLSRGLRAGASYGYPHWLRILGRRPADR
ncbi:MAG: hypothetical protein ACRDJG_11205 [Actinomycetota bacterium]